MEKSTNIRILFFIGSLRSGGKERRLVELLSYLQKSGGYEMMLVMTKDEIHYPAFFDLNIPYKIISSGSKKNKFYTITDFYKLCKEYHPDIVHVWGRMQCFYSLPAVLLQKIFLINSQITAAPPKLKKWSFSNFVNRLNFLFSDIILANSKAGIEAFNPPAKKSKVIYNGINLDRFNKIAPIEDIKRKYGILTPYVVLKVASFTPNKDYDLFFRVAEKVTKLRTDISFIGVGGFDKSESEFKRLVALSQGNERILFPGKIKDVEALINASTVGVLFTNTDNHGEGISNSVMEFLSSSKPVIANDAGGTNEIIFNDKTGYLINSQNEDEIAGLILHLVENESKRNLFGKNGRKLIEDSFSLQKMGEAFEHEYRLALKKEFHHEKVPKSYPSVLAEQITT